MTISIGREKPVLLSLFFVGLSCSTFKDDNVKEKSQDNDFQSEGKNPCFFNGFMMAMNLVTSLQYGHLSEKLIKPTVF